ncbi:MAG: hypothetical protein M3R30_04340 [Candidatus Eremiobacteraeota bacterium]|nr:hypothetical protein [Candidatus Eremiobacteraeota bacterium]
MAHPHPYSEANAALFLSTAPVLAVVGLFVGERVEAFRRRARPPEEPGAALVPGLTPAIGLE